MAELKTKPSGESVELFLETVEESRRQDCYDLLQIMLEVTGASPMMWGSRIVGFGSYRYRYASGRSGEWFVTGFAPRKNGLTLYLTDGLDRHPDLLARLGKHTAGRGCLYIKRLADLDRAVLRQLIMTAEAGLREAYPSAEA